MDPLADHAMTKALKNFFRDIKMISLFSLLVYEITVLLIVKSSDLSLVSSIAAGSETLEFDFFPSVSLQLQQETSLRELLTVF